MTIDIKTVGTLGISFSRGLDQTWLNILRRDDGYTLEFYQNVEDEDSDEDDEIIDASFTIPYEQGEEILRQVFAQGRLEDWKAQYGGSDGVRTDLNWTIDVDDLNDADLLMVSGNGALPPEGLMNAVIEAVRAGEPRFAACFCEFR
ncbi:MAG: hypothetical protein IKQ10_08135 [Oscillospiraceae bacterium]|nr:hypothetical protein [Oscillospiraceae bacterium]